MPGTMESFDITCQSNGQWDQVKPYPDCYEYCKGPFLSWAERQDLARKGLSENDITWDCTNGGEPGSVCTKKCPDGWKLNNESKNRVTCTTQRSGVDFTGAHARCVRDRN
jgi:hypothetical protein